MNLPPLPASPLQGTNPHPQEGAERRLLVMGGAVVELSIIDISTWMRRSQVFKPLTEGLPDLAPYQSLITPALHLQQGRPAAVLSMVDIKVAAGVSGPSSTHLSMVDRSPIAGASRSPQGAVRAVSIVDNELPTPASEVTPVPPSMARIPRSGSAVSIVDNEPQAPELSGSQAYLSMIDKTRTTGASQNPECRFGEISIVDIPCLATGIGRLATEMIGTLRPVSTIDIAMEGLDGRSQQSPVEARLRSSAHLNCIVSRASTGWRLIRAAVTQAPGSSQIGMPLRSRRWCAGFVCPVGHVNGRESGRSALSA